MHLSRAATLASWLISAVAIGVGLFSGSYMQMILRGEAVESRSGTIAAFVAFSLVCGLPWYRAYLLDDSTQNHTFRWVFSSAATVLALFFSAQVASGQDFAIGLHIIFFLLAVFTAYPLLAWLCRW